ncbi:pentatricopeptide repeat-containing protein [Tanacetum coccineum]|uniref:Pentatricopeptide repeat-containing protein n=1 Tax=Tanacetum coccineum TaxID=301880 RepID=A0ABQ4YVI4_9ASTR
MPLSPHHHHGPHLTTTAPWFCKSFYNINLKRIELITTSYCPGVLGGDTGNGSTYFYITARVFLEETPVTRVHILYITAQVFLEGTPLGEKFLNVKKFKECLTYYAMANEFLLWFERNNKDKIVAKHGQRKETIMDPSQGLIDGSKIGYRRIIALDGCFLKKPNTGEILTAVGRGGNNHIFPVAWAVVSVENKDNWSWFLELLADDLELTNGIGLTLMSDQLKRLIKEVKDVMPHVEHQECARHIYEGFKNLGNFLDSFKSFLPTTV